MSAPTPRTFVYVDGFNLYYGALRGTSFKWLNLVEACRKALPRNDVVRIKYFTARISARANDHGQVHRQNAYLRALSTCPEVGCIYGSFLVSKTRLPRADGDPSNPEFVSVLKPEEKGSDVNLAAHMVSDAAKGLYEAAVLVTNDSDFAEAMRIVRSDWGRLVGVLYPERRGLNSRLQAQASFARPLRPGVLKACQFAARLADDGKDGPITKPSSW
jgi:uncharacterized LabA/DUF88 family protein